MSRIFFTLTTNSLTLWQITVLVTQCPSLSDPMQCAPSGFSVLGKNIGVGSHFLLQGIFSTQGLNPGSPALQVDCLSSEPLGKPSH